MFFHPGDPVNTVYRCAESEAEAKTSPYSFLACSLGVHSNFNSRGGNRRVNPANGLKK